MAATFASACAFDSDGPDGTGALLVDAAALVEGETGELAAGVVVDEEVTASEGDDDDDADEIRLDGEDEFDVELPQATMVAPVNAIAPAATMTRWATARSRPPPSPEDTGSSMPYRSRPK